MRFMVLPGKYRGSGMPLHAIDDVYRSQKEPCLKRDFRAWRPEKLSSHRLRPTCMYRLGSSGSSALGAKTRTGFVFSAALQQYPAGRRE
jgi:hypothetical protein